MDQLMISYGFNSEIAQNQVMSVMFDKNSSDNSLKLQETSLSLTNQSKSIENSLTKKVNIFNLSFFFFFFYINF